MLVFPFEVTMRRYGLLCLAAAIAAFLLVAAARPGERSISLAELRDKIEGGWAGQMIGVSYGAPTEFRSLEKTIDGELPAWTPDRLTNSIKQDDLYVDMTFAQVLDDKGLDATTEDFGAMFKEAKYSLWHANLAARRALRRGVSANLSGTPKYNAHANDIDFQIESDFIGLMAPGLPVAATDIAWRAGRVMNYGDGIYGGILMSCMYSVAFFETDPHRVVEEGLKCLPEKSPYAMLISDVLAWHKENPNDWKANWRKIEQKWNKREPCPEGAMRPFNIDAKLNGAYVVLGLLYGDGDFFKTADVSTRAGQDSDCNPSTACGILGTMKGYKWIPEQWKSGIPKIANEKFDYTNYTFKTIVDSTEKRAIALVKRTGGRLEGQNLIVKTQAPKSTKLELWDDYGSPVERIAVADPRWQWTGNWRKVTQGRTANDKGAEATIAFEGTGAMIVGPYLPTGGKAEVYLDGKLDKVIDIYPDEPHAKGGESVWHAFKLKPGKHTLRLVVLGEPYAGSKGSDISIRDLVVFR
jgi:hypothetical protein